jgi:peptidoglycan glycosyltransferase
MNGLQRAVRALAVLAGLGIIGYGMTLSAVGPQGRWLLCLGLGGMLIGIGLWPAAHSIANPDAKPVVNVVTAIAIIFAMLGVQMARVQLISSDSIADRSGVDPASADVLSNPRQSTADLVIKRGSIVDRNGVVLAESFERDGVYDRRYPVDTASYICGYFSPLKYGEVGLEAAYDDLLSGADSGNPIRNEINDLLGRDTEGAELQLTIDADLQEQAHALLGDRIGSVVVIDVKTGAILVLASNPHLDPNGLVAIDGESALSAADYWAELNADPAQPLLVRSTDGLYTPGSTFKTVTAAAAIDTGAAEPDDVYEDDGQLEVDGRVIVENNRPDASIDRWTLTEGLMYSLNVVLAQVGLQIGGDTLRDYAQRFGFGQEIPFDVPVTSGQVASSSSFLDSPAALADTAFGQGQLLTTPLGMALVAAAFANGGEMMRPYLVERVVSADGDVIEVAEPSVWRRPVSVDTAKQVQEMMIATVEQGFASAAAINGFVVGGKTGTAETGQEAPHAWYIGFAGEGEPRYAVAVVLEHGGSGLSDPIFIAREMLIGALNLER